MGPEASQDEMTRQISFRLKNQDQSWKFIDPPKSQVVVSKKTIQPVFFSTSFQSQGILFKFSDPRRSFKNSESVKMFQAAGMCFLGGGLKHLFFSSLYFC